MGLASAISWYAEGFSERSSIEVALDIPKNLPRFSPDVETALFRVVQQSLANIHRHSCSKVAVIRLRVEGGTLRVEISDEGRGFAPEMLSRFRQSGQLPGVGISGMRERINRLHGSFEINSNATGAKIVVTLPVAQLS
jgi:signal transduction histidine kinase